MSKMSYEHNPLKTPFDGRPWYKLLDSRAEHCPDTEAVVMYDMDKNRSAMTFALYKDRSMYMAASLIELGLSRGRNVLLISRTSMQCMVFAMALGRIGANAILLGPGSLTKDKVHDLLKRLNCQIIAYDAKMQESQRKQLFEGINQLVQCGNSNENPILISLSSDSGELSNCHTYESLIEHGRFQDLKILHDAQNEVQFDDPAIAIFTTGSTGKPKLVQHTMHSLVNVFGETAFSSSQIPCIKIYNDRPFSWLGGYIICHSALSTNLIPVCVPTEMALSSATNNTVFQILESEKCTMCQISIALIHKLYLEKLHLEYNLSHVQVFILAGQRFSLDSVAKLLDIFPTSKVLLSYGCSESLKISVAVMERENAMEAEFGKMSIIPGVELKVVDENEKVVPRGNVGEICARNATVFLEYVDGPEATKQAKSPTGWLRTEDLGIMHEDGKIEVLGRKSEIIKRATVKIFPAEVENVLVQHPNVADVVVFGIPDQMLHEEICACVVLRQDTDSMACDEKIMLEELEDWCEKQFPPGPDGLSLRPKYILPIKKIPMMSTGKVSTREIKAEAMKQLEELKGHT